MAFYPLERLQEGNCDFVTRLNENDYYKLINDVRNSFNKIDIINGFIEVGKSSFQDFTFEIIYDIEEYKSIVFELLNNEEIYNSTIKSVNKITNILYKTKWGKDFVFDNLNNILGNEDMFKIIFSYIFLDYTNNYRFIEKLRFHPNLHIRCEFMKYLIVNHCDKVNLIYDDITKYLTSYTHQENEQMTFAPLLMNSDDISSLAIAIYDSKLDKSMWIKIKEFILTNYKSNKLSSLLLSSVTKDKIVEFSKDADRLFETSHDYKLEIYKSYSKYLSQKIITNFTKYINYFYKEGSFDKKLKKIIYYGLWDELKILVDKYLSLSKTEDYRYLTRGTTTSCHKIGDFVFKLDGMKWSYEDVICPNLYLIIKNLEEHFIRDENGHVVAGIEVEQYLSRCEQITEKDAKWFNQELSSLGYYLKDTLIGGATGNNCMLLDSYKDADCSNPEALPQRFKDFPMVLVDRDLVYKKDNKRPKCLLGHRY